MSDHTIVIVLLVKIFFVFIRVHGWSAVGFPGWAGLINSTQKIRVLVNSAEVIFKGHMRGRHWEVGETVD